MTASRSPSFAACRAFLAELATHVDGGSRDREAPPHARTCARCAARWRAARAQARALRSLPRPELPAAAAASVLDGVFEREVERGEAAVRELLERSLPAARAPEDVEWVQPPAEGPLRTRLRRWLPPVQAPGWLWARVRARVRPASGRPAAATTARWARVAAAAAILVVGAWTLRGWIFESQKQGTSPVPGLVWLQESEPLDASLAPTHVLRELGR